METMDSRIIFFILAAFGMIYGTVLIATSAHYCVQLDNAYSRFQCPDTSHNGTHSTTIGTTPTTRKDLTNAVDIVIITTVTTTEGPTTSTTPAPTTTSTPPTTSTTTTPPPTTTPTTPPTTTPTTPPTTTPTTPPTTTPTTPPTTTTPPGSTTLPPDENFDLFCERYTKWRSCSIVGMFVGTLLLVYSILTTYFRYPGTSDDYVSLDDPPEYDNINTCSLGFVSIASIVMVTTIFAVLIDSQANTIGYKAYQGLKPAAVGNIVILGLGVGVPILGILVGVVLMPIIRCAGDLRDSSGF